MLKWRQALVYAFLLVAGCRTPPLQSIDQSVRYYASRPMDIAPVPAGTPASAPPPTGGVAPGAAASRDGAPIAETKSATVIRLPPIERVIAGQVTPQLPTVTLVSAQVEQKPQAGVPGAPALGKFDLKIPEIVPGAETPRVTLPHEQAARKEAVYRVYAHLPPFAEEPVPLPGPTGRPYTLADLQQLAAANSPVLRQAASDVEAARGALQQARTYVNPTMGFESAPNANNTSSSTYGGFVDQVIITGGKLKLAAAAAEADLRNAELALRKARYDLATQVRTAYYNCVVARETVRVNRSLAHFTDEVYRLQADLLAGGFAASHEPAALRSQVFLVRLSYKQAITNYVYTWKQLVSAIGLPQMPFSAVEGQVDRLIPYYDYDVLLAYVLRNHTDVLSARNSVAGARYNLKLAQIIPVPNVDVRGDLWQETQILPRQNYHTFQVGVPFPIFDQNRGNIRTATAGLIRAGEGPHQVELALTTGLAAAYGSYKQNLAAVDYYRRNILPDQVRYYRGVFERRQIDPGASFNDLVTAQQTLVADVTAYLGILGELWTSVVTVADFLQTDDFYQLGTPQELPPLPDFDALRCWPCPHPHPDVAFCPEGQTTAGYAADKATAVSEGGSSTHSSDAESLAGNPDPRLTVIRPVSFVSLSGAVPSIAQRASDLSWPRSSTPLPPASARAPMLGPAGATPMEMAVPAPR